MTNVKNLKEKLLEVLNKSIVMEGLYPSQLREIISFVSSKPDEVDKKTVAVLKQLLDCFERVVGSEKDMIKILTRYLEESNGDAKLAKQKLMEAKSAYISNHPELSYLSKKE